jgi:hypothetical protein
MDSKQVVWLLAKPVSNARSPAACNRRQRSYICQSLLLVAISSLGLFG